MQTTFWPIHAWSQVLKPPRDDILLLTGIKLKSAQVTSPWLLGFRSAHLCPWNTICCWISSTWKTLRSCARVSVMFLVAVIRNHEKMRGREGLFHLTVQGDSLLWWGGPGGRSLRQLVTGHPRAGSKGEWILVLRRPFPLHSEVPFHGDTKYYHVVSKLNHIKY